MAFYLNGSDKLKKKMNILVVIIQMKVKINKILKKYKKSIKMNYKFKN